MKKASLKKIAKWTGIGFIMMAALCMGVSSSFADALTADHHAAANFNKIPTTYFSKARSDFKIYYGHTDTFFAVECYSLRYLLMTNSGGISQSTENASVRSDGLVLAVPAKFYAPRESVGTT